MIKKNMIYSFSQHILVYMKGIILIPILIKLLDVSTYGAYVLITTLSGFIVGLSMLGISFKMTRFLPSSTTKEDIHENIYVPFYFHLFVITVLSLLIIPFWDILTKPLVDDDITLYYWVFTLYIFANVFYRYVPNFFRYTHRVGVFSISEVVRPYSEIIIIVGILYFLDIGLDLNDLLLIGCFSFFAVSLPLFIKMLKEINISIPKYSIKKFKYDFRLGFPLTLAYLVDVIIASSDKFVIGYLLSATAAGYYAPAYAIGSLIILVPKALGVALPQMMIKYRDNGEEDKYIQLFKLAVYIHILFCIPFIIGSYFYGKEVLELFTNTDIAQSGHMVLFIVALSMLFYGMNLIINIYLSIELKTKTIFRVNSVIALFNLLANIILISIYKDIIVAAYTTLLSYLISNLILYRFISYINFDLKLYIKNIIFIIFISIFINFLNLNYFLSISLTFIISVIYIYNTLINEMRKLRI